MIAQGGKQNLRVLITVKTYPIPSKKYVSIFRPKKVHDLVISNDTSEWPIQFLHALRQQRLFEYRQKTLVPPRKVPLKFHYWFECDDSRCKGNHRMMIEDWAVGAVFWKLVDKGVSHQEASEKVRDKFLNELCGPDKDTYFYGGTILAHPRTWVVLGVFYPKKQTEPVPWLTLFSEDGTHIQRGRDGCGRVHRLYLWSEYRTGRPEQAFDWKQCFGRKEKGGIP